MISEKMLGHRERKRLKNGLVSWKSFQNSSLSFEHCGLFRTLEVFIVRSLACIIHTTDTESVWLPFEIMITKPCIIRIIVLPT